MSDAMKSRKSLEEEIELLTHKRDQLEQQLNLERNKWLYIFDNIGEPVYVATMDTYEILYANQAVRSAFGVNNNDKCYEILQGGQEQCDFCTNSMIKKPGDEVVWEFQNRRNGRWYRCIDRGIRWSDGRLVRLELAVDITDLKNSQESQEEWIAILKQAIKLATDAI